MQIWPSEQSDWFPLLLVRNHWPSLPTETGELIDATICFNEDIYLTTQQDKGDLRHNEVKSGDEKESCVETDVC